jgi:hypothetical protein
VAIGDARDTAFEPTLVGSLAILEGRGLQAHRVEVAHVIAGDNTAAEAADAGIISRARDIARLLREGSRHLAADGGCKADERKNDGGKSIRDGSHRQ